MKPGLAVLPLEVWANVFLSPWFTRQELAQLLNGIRNRCFANKLDKLLHGCGKPTLGVLKISSELNSWQYQLRKCKQKASRKLRLRKWHIRKIPRCQAILRVEENLLDSKECKFPQCEMPENIKGFNELEIGHLDDQVLNFLDKLKPLFVNVFLSIHTEKSTNEKTRILFDHLFPMLASIREISCTHGYLPTLGQQFPGTLALARELSLYADNANASIPALLTWLSAPINFDKHGPRFLHATVRGNDGFAVVDAVRQLFLSATTPSTFVIFIQFEGPHNSIDQFKLELQNAATNEELTAQKAWLYDIHGFYHYYLEILRHPVGANAKVREWIKKRAYFDKFWNEEGQMISICNWRWSPLTIGRITRKANAIMDEEESSDNEENKAGPSTKK